MLFTARRDADDDDEQENYASRSVAAIIMMVFQYSEDPGESLSLTPLSQFMAMLSVFDTKILSCECIRYNQENLSGS
jgi:hypothetical protein